MQNNKRIILTGATGEIGLPLAHKLVERGYNLIVFSRDPQSARHKVIGAVEYVQWAAEEQGDWMRHVDGAYALINCAGTNMFTRRYRGKFAQEVIHSRQSGTRGLVNAIARAQVKPSVFINSSSQGYYGITDFDDRLIDENTPAGTKDQWGRESAELDAEAFKAESYEVRVVSMRTGYVLDADGGGLPQQVTRVRKNQGGATTPLNAWRSWIHITDEVGLYLFALEDQRVSGGLNATAPNPVTSEEFANQLSITVLGKSNTKKFPGLIIRILVGPAADLMTHGKRIIPRKALDLGFQFQYPTLEKALSDLVPKIK